MSEQRGSLRGLADHLAQAVAPLDRMLRDPEAFAIAMGRVGWLAEELPPSYAAVADAAADAVAAASALADDAELAEVVVLLDAVGAVYRAVDDLTVAPPGADPDDFLPVIARELFEYLLADHLAKKAPGFLWALQALGVIDFEPVAPAGGRPGFVRTRFAWELLPDALSDPGAIPAELFGWGAPDFDFARVAETVSELLAGIGVSASVDRVSPDLIEAIQGQPTGEPARAVFLGFTVLLFDSPVDYQPVGISVIELPAEGAAAPGMVVLPKVPAGIDSELDVGGGWTFSVRADTDLAEQLGIVVRPGEAFVRYPFAPGKPLPAGRVRSVAHMRLRPAARGARRAGRHPPRAGEHHLLARRRRGGRGARAGSRSAARRAGAGALRGLAGQLPRLDARRLRSRASRSRSASPGPTAPAWASRPESASRSRSVPGSRSPA